jgi:hypothetical protein
MAVQGYRFAGDVEIKTLSIITKQLRKIDIKSLYLEINIYHDIYEHYAYCDIVIEDAINLNEMMGGDVENRIPTGFSGVELLEVVYRERIDPSTEADTPWRTQQFALYELSDKSRSGEFVETYILSGVSIEAYVATSQRISKAYGAGGGNTITNMMKSLVKEYVHSDVLNNKIFVDKEIVVDETNGLQSFVIPSLTVDDTIEFLSDEADSPDHYPFYRFYEDAKGFNFRNMGDLINQPPVATYFHFIANVNSESDDVETQDQFKIISYNVEKTSNILENARGGLFEAKTINLDILKKTAKTTKFDYDKEIDNFNTLQGGVIPGAGVVGRELVENLLTSRTGHDDDSKFQKENHLPKRINAFSNRKASYQRQIFNDIIELTVPGNTKLDIGKTIYLIFNIHNNVADDQNKIDKFLSGRYLITKVRQKITDNVFTTMLECSKDTGLI